MIIIVIVMSCDVLGLLPVLYYLKRSWSFHLLGRPVLLFPFGLNEVLILTQFLSQAEVINLQTIEISPLHTVMCYVMLCHVMPYCVTLLFVRMRFQLFLNCALYISRYSFTF
jgi:hypothetical protein